VNYGKVPADHVYSSADWSPSELLREKQNWYCHLGFEILENLRVDTIDTSCFYLLVRPHLSRWYTVFHVSDFL